MRRMEVLARASQEMADLAGEVDKATDPDAIRPDDPAARAGDSREVACGLSGDAGARLGRAAADGEHLWPDPRAGDRRALALRTDAFNARVLDAQSGN